MNESSYYDSENFLQPSYYEDQEKKAREVIKSSMEKIEKIYMKTLTKIKQEKSEKIKEQTTERIKGSIETSKIGGLILHDYKNFVSRRIAEVFKQAYGDQYNAEIVMNSLIFTITSDTKGIYPDFSWNTNMVLQSIKITEYNKKSFNKNYYSDNKISSQMELISSYDTEMDIIGALDGEDYIDEDIPLELYSETIQGKHFNSILGRTVIEPAKLLKGIRGDALNWYIINKNKYYDILNKKVNQK